MLNILFPKPKTLIETIIKQSSNRGDTVADYYLGNTFTVVVKN